MVEMNAENVSGAAIRVSGYERGDGVYVKPYLRGADGRKIDDVEVDVPSIASPTLSKKKKKAVAPPLIYLMSITGFVITRMRTERQILKSYLRLHMMRIGVQGGMQQQTSTRRLPR